MQRICLLAVLSFVTVLGALPAEVSAVPIGAFDSRYQYVGSIGGLYGGSSYHHRGTGVLVAPDVVLTAGHVAEVAAPGGEVVFLTGADPVFDEVETVTTVWNAVFHPLYDTSDEFGGYDLALLFLSAPVLLDQYAVLAPFAPETLVGEPAEVVGYGSDARRKSAEREITSFLDGEYLVLEEGFVESGDSGGGLFVERDGEAVLAGITSWMMSPWGYGAFEPVAFGRSFIDEHVQGANWFGEAISVPEPCTALLLLTGLAGAAARRVSRR